MKFGLFFKDILEREIKASAQKLQIYLSKVGPWILSYVDKEKLSDLRSISYLLTSTVRSLLGDAVNSDTSAFSSLIWIYKFNFSYAIKKQWCSDSNLPTKYNLQSYPNFLTEADEPALTQMKRTY